MLINICIRISVDIHNVENVKTSNHHYVNEQLVNPPSTAHLDEGISTHPDHPTPFLYNNGRVVLFRFGIVKTPIAETRSSIRIKLSSQPIWIRFLFWSILIVVYPTALNRLVLSSTREGGTGLSQSQFSNLEGKLLFFLALK